MEGVDFIEEIRIARFWRRLLGEFEYVDYNPEDLRRWYVALELRGPADIRDYLIERTNRHPAGAVTGIVTTPPHPPLDVINLWLHSFDHFSTTRLWLGLFGFIVVTYYSTGYLSGCQHINQMVMKPPQIGGPLLTSQPAGAPVAAATAPAALPPPGSKASPPTGTPGSYGNYSPGGTQHP